MSTSSGSGLSGGYFPVYPHRDALPDPEIRTFITNFYRVSDNPERNELWVSHFAKDAKVVMGNDRGEGQEEIRQLRSRMWTSVQERKHTVVKVFPGRFHEEHAEGSDNEYECMLFGEVNLRTKDGNTWAVPWAGHAVLKKEKEGEKDEWKFGYYRVWLQR